MDDLSPKKFSLMTREWAIAAVAANVGIFACGFLSDKPANYYAGLQALLLLETAIVLLWYTVETAAIRRVSQQQSEASHRQVELTQMALEKAERDRRRSVAPKFVFRAHQIVDGVVTVKLLNCGARVTHLEIAAEGYNATVAPPLAGPDDVVRVQVHGVSVSTDPISITLGYRDADDHFNIYPFYWIHGKGPVEYL